MQNYYRFLIIILFLFLSENNNLNAQSCQTATPICNGMTFTITPTNGMGMSTNLPVSNPTNNPFPPNNGCLYDGGIHTNWLIITVTSPGMLGFSLGDANGPNPQAGLYDWVLWPYSQNVCNAIYNDNVAPVACNWNAAPSGGTGVGQVPPGASAGNFQPSFPVTAGQKFILIMSNFNLVTSLVTFSSTGTAGLGCSPEIITCANISQTYTVNTSLNNASYVLNPGNITQSSPVFTVNSSSTQIYTVTISGVIPSNSQAVTYNSNFTYSVEVLPTISVANPLYFCSNTPVTFTANPFGNYNLTLDGPNGFSSSYPSNTIILNNFNSSSNGVYTLSSTSSLGCKGSTTLAIDISSITNVTIDPLSPVCVGESFTLNASIPTTGSYAWTGPNSYTSNFQNNIIDSPILQNSGTYEVKVDFSHGSRQCQLTKTVSMSIEECTGLPETEYLNLKIWPNPTQGVIYISGQEAVSHLEIIDFAGRVIKMTLKENKGDLGFLQDGIYLVRLFSGDKISAEKRILILK